MILMFGSALAQEGKAERPAPKPECIISATSQPALESCTFRQYRFMRESGPGFQGFAVSRMESGHYIPTSLGLIFKDKERSLAAINKSLRKEVDKNRKSGHPCEWVDLDFSQLGLRFEDDKAIIAPLTAGCTQMSLSLRELDRMLK